MIFYKYSKILMKIKTHQMGWTQHIDQ